MPRLSAVVLLLLLAELALVVLVLKPEPLREARVHEYEMSEVGYGERLAVFAKDLADKSFTAHFIDSGLVEFAEQLFLPTEDAKRRTPELEAFRGNPFFFWVSTRLEAFWILIYGIYHRSILVILLLAHGVVLIVPLLVDALVQRRINITNYEIANSVFYHSAKRFLGALVVAPLFLIIAPIHLTAALLGAWLLVFAPTIWIGAKNVQEI